MKSIMQISIAVVIAIFIGSCGAEKNHTDEELMMKSHEVTQKVFANLSQRLKDQIEKGGVAQAIDYCHLHALSITDSLSKTENVTVRRSTLQARNAANRASGQDSVVINNYLTAIKEGQVVKPVLSRYSDGTYDYYAPIYISDFCLQCHGTPGKDITSDNLSLIRSKYPDDLATGYSNGDLRGVWVVSYRK